MKNHLIRTIIILTILAGRVICAETFNVNFDATGIPQISGPGGSLPPPTNLPAISTLSPSQGDAAHISGGAPPTARLWIDSYQAGDYFHFTVSALQPGERIRLDGIWFGLDKGSRGPDTFSIELWSASSLVASRQTTNSLEDWTTTWSSTDGTVDIRFVGIGGTNDFGPGPYESYGIWFASASFTVLPRPVHFVGFARGPERLLLSISGVTLGTTNELQATTNLVANDWHPIQTFVGMTTETNITQSFTNEHQQRYFRILTKGK